MKRSGLIVGLIIIALTAGSVLAFGKSYAKDIYTYDCEYLEQRRGLAHEDFIVQRFEVAVANLESWVEWLGR